MAIKDMIQYLNEVKIELSRVEWPTFSVFVGSTIVVLMLVVFFAIYLGLVDYTFASLARYIFSTYNI